MQPIKSYVFHLFARVAALLPGRQIIFQADAKTHHLRLTSGVQWVSVAIVAAMLIGAVQFAWTWHETAAEREAANASYRALAEAAGKAERHRQSVEARTRELEARQDFIDDLYRAHFGEDGSPTKEALTGPSDKASGSQTAHALDGR